MHEKKVTKYYKDVTAKDVWDVCKVVEKWPNWWNGLKSCEINGEFKTGNTFTLTPVRGPATKVLLKNVEEEKSFTNEACFFGAKMNDGLIIEQRDGGVELTTFVRIKGPLAFLWFFLVGRSIISGAQRSMKQLIDLARDHTIIKNH